MKFFFYNLLTVAILLTFTSKICAQDSNFVRQYGNMFSVKSFLYSDGFSFFNKSTGFNYIPDKHSGIGVGIWFKYIPFDFCYRQEISYIGHRNYHRQKTTDMQLRGYNKYFAGDIYIQHYQGFYESLQNRFQNNSQDITELMYQPNLSVFQYDMVGKYIFNHDEFSYKAGFTANEKQLISAGSFTVGMALYYLKIKSDSLLVVRDDCNFKSCNIGFNGGYAYNWVWGQHSTAFVSGMIGLNASTSVLKGRNNNDLHLSPAFHLKTAYWLNYDKWSFGITGTYNIINHYLDDNMILYVHTHRAEILVIRRIFTS